MDAIAAGGLGRREASVPAGPAEGPAVVLGYDLAIHQVQGAAAPHRVNVGLDAAGLAWDRRLGLVMSQAAEKAFYAWLGKKWRRVASGVRTEYLRTGGDGWVRVIEPTTVSTMRVLQVDRGKLVAESRFRFGPGFLDVAILANGDVWVAEASGLRRQGAIVQDPATARLWHPAVLAADGMTLYVLSGDGRFLYRRSGHGRFSAVDLLDVSLSDAFVREPFQRGLQPLDDEGIALLAGRHVLLLRLRHANWRVL
jgi:hypothetical protein